MAQPIKYTPLEHAPSPHEGAINSGLDLLQAMHDKGILDLLRGAVGSGGELVKIAADAVDQPDPIRGIRNFVLLTQFFASIPPDALKSLVQTVQSGAKREKAHKAPSLWQLLKRLRSEDTRHGLAVTLDLVEGLGRGL